MPVGSTLTHALGIVLGILIPGTSAKDPDLARLVRLSVTVGRWGGLNEPPLA